MIPLTNYDFQWARSQWARDEIYPASCWMVVVMFVDPYSPAEQCEIQSKHLGKQMQTAAHI